jgi:hypothetical protein
MHARLLMEQTTYLCLSKTILSKSFIARFPNVTHQLLPIKPCILSFIRMKLTFLP